MAKKRTASSHLAAEALKSILMENPTYRRLLEVQRVIRENKRRMVRMYGKAEAERMCREADRMAAENQDGIE